MYFDVQNTNVNSCICIENIEMYISKCKSFYQQSRESLRFCEILKFTDKTSDVTDFSILINMFGV